MWRRNLLSIWKKNTGPSVHSVSSFRFLCRLKRSVVPVDNISVVFWLTSCRRPLEAKIYPNNSSLLHFGYEFLSMFRVILFLLVFWIQERIYRSCVTWFTRFLRILFRDRHFFFLNCGGDMHLHNSQHYIWFCGTMEDVCKHEINLEGDSAKLNRSLAWVWD